MSATATAPRTAPSQPTSTAVRPACSHSRHCAASPGGIGQAVSGEQPLAPDDDLAAVDGAARAEPGQGPEPVGLRQRPRFRLAAAVIAAATACSDACSTAPA